MADDKIQLDAEIKNGDQVKKLGEDLNVSTKAAEKLANTLDKIVAKLGTSAKEADTLRKAIINTSKAQGGNYSAGSISKVSKDLSFGDPNTQLINSLARSEKATLAAINNQKVAELQTKRQIVASKDELVLKQQIEAQTYRVANAERDASNATSKLRSYKLGQLEAEQLALKNLQKSHLELKQEANRAQKLSTLTGDSGASLFKIQAQLLVNYTLMNQVFSLFRFGTQFVLEYDKALYDLAAITDTTSLGMRELSDTIIEVSRTSKFSAVEVAKAATIMGQAGFSAQEIKDSIGGVIKFATATGTDLTTAVDTATSVISVFNLQASEMGHVADVLTASINLSKLTTEKLALGIQYAGNAAAEAGTTFEELSAALGAMSNAGIKSGSTLGTGLRQLFIEFQTPTKKLAEELAKVGLKMSDVDVQSQGLIPVIEKLKDAGFNSANAFKAFEVRSAAAYLALSRNTKAAKDMYISMQYSTAATKASETQMKSLSNTIDNLKSALGTLIYQASGPIVDALYGMAKAASVTIGVISKLGVVLPVLGSVLISTFTAAIGVQLFKLTANLLGFKRAAEATTTAVTLLNGAINLSPLKIIALGLTAMSLAAYAFSGSLYSSKARLDELSKSVEESKGQYESAMQSVESLDQEMTRLNDRYVVFKKDSSLVSAEVLNLRNKFGEFTSDLRTDTITTIDQLRDALLKLRGEMLKTAQQKLKLEVAAQVNLLQYKSKTASDEAANASLYFSSGFGQQVGKAGINTNKISSNFSSMAEILGVVAGLDISKLPQAKRDGLKTAIEKNLYELQDEQLKAQNEINRLTAQGKSSKVFKNIVDDIKKRTSAYNEILATFVETSSKQTLAESSKVINTVAYTALYKKIDDLKAKIADETGNLNAAKSEKEKAESKKKIENYNKALSNILLAIMGKKSADILNMIAKESGLDSQSAQSIVNEELSPVITDALNKSKEGIAKSSETFGATSRDYFDKLTEQLKTAIDRVLRVVEKSSEVYDRELAKLDAVIAQTEDRQYGGLRNVYSDAEVEGFKKQRRQVEGDRIKDRLDKSQEALGPINDLVAREEQLYQAAQRKYNANKKNGNALKEMVEAEKDLNSAYDTRDKLLNEINQLEAEHLARTGQLTMSHMSLGEQIRQTTEDYIAEKEVMTDIRLNIKRDLTDVLDSAGEGFKGFVKDIVTGTDTVGGAFRKMASKVIESMLDIAANAAANQLLGLGKSILGSVFGSMFGSPQVYSSPIGPTQPSTFNGLNKGGYVTAAQGKSIKTRDAIPVIARDGEYVLRNSAVDMIGKDNLDRLNSMGNNRISASLTANQNSAMPQSREPVVTNVYVVSPEKKPTLTKGDILVTINDNLARGGETAQLIKSIVR